MLEPLVILFLFCTLSFTAVYALPCQDKPSAPFDLNYGTNGTGELKFFDKICDDPEKEYHPLGTLVFASADNTVRMLFRRGNPNDREKGGPLEGTKVFDYYHLIIFFLLYSVFACWSAGTFLACGLVVPMLTIGAAMGRVYGLFVVDLMQNLAGEDCNGVDAWVDPGVFALFGAAGFFAGVSRLTFSLCVIMLEITGDLPHLPNIMLCVMVAKTVADYFTHALYHALLELKCVPFLDFDIHLPYLDCYTAKDLIKANPTRPMNLLTRESIGNIMHMLHDTPHNAFPVVQPGSLMFKGTVLRSQLEQLLWFIASCEEEDEDVVPKLDHEGMTAIRERIFWERLQGLPFKDGLPADLSEKIIDLLPLTNTSAFTVPDTMSVSATYTLFRGMGLRHMVVLNSTFHVLGIITRKDLVAHTILKHTIESNRTTHEVIEEQHAVFGSPIHTHHANPPSGSAKVHGGSFDRSHGESFGTPGKRGSWKGSGPLSRMSGPAKGGSAKAGGSSGDGFVHSYVPASKVQSMLNLSAGLRTVSPASASSGQGTPRKPESGPSIQADQLREEK